MKIGIILDTNVQWYINDLVNWINKNPKLTLILLIQNIKSKRKSILKEKVSKILDRVLFKFINIIEKNLIYKKYLVNIKNITLNMISKNLKLKKLI